MYYFWDNDSSEGGFVNFAERKSGTFPYTPQSTSLVPTNAEPMFGVRGLNGFLRYGRGLFVLIVLGLPEPFGYKPKFTFRDVFNFRRVA